MKKIGIIGAGPGGLAAAILLANSGFDVTVYEKKDRVGGRNSYLKADGYTFDIGPTFFMMPFILEEIFAEAGADLHDYVDLKLLAPYYQLVYHDGKKMLPSNNFTEVKESINNINSSDVEGFDRYMQDNRKKMKYTLPVLQRPFNNFFDLFNTDLLRLLTVLKPHKSLWQDLGDYFTDDIIKVGFTFQSKYLGMSPYNCPSMFSILPFTEYEWGVFHVMGGLNQLSQQMAVLVKELGGEIKLEHEVKEINIVRGRAEGIRLTDNSYHEFDEIVMNADFAYGMKDLIPDQKRKKYSNINLDAKRYSCSTFMLYLGLDKIYDNLEHNNVYIAKDYEKNFLEIESKKVLSEDPSFYVQNASVTDPSLAPEGHSTLYVLVPTANLKSQIDWQKDKSKFRDLIIRKLKNRVGLEDIEKHITYEKILSPVDWQNEMSVGYGATFNLAHNLGQMLLFRPHNKFEEFENMWLVGGGTNPGSGLPTIYESGRITANLISEKHNVSYSTNYLHNKNRTIEKSI